MITVAHPLARALPRDAGIDADGRLEIGGCDAVELAREFGTPAYVVAEGDLRGRAREFVDGLARHHDGVGEVVFASKAFPCTAVGRIFAEEGLGCDVASGGELHLALRAGFDPARIHLHGNAKSREELGAALTAGIGHVVLDSHDDLDRLEAIAEEADARPRVLLRITPGIAGDTHAAISTGQADSKFGFGLAEAPQAIGRLERSPRLELAGLHMHVGSQLLSLDWVRPAVAALAPLGDFALYNLGGGLGVSYTAEQTAPPPQDFAAAVAAAVREELGEGKHVVIEPGRALTANAGVTLYTVETVKRNLSTWVAVDGGMSDNLRPMLYGARYGALIADRASAGGGEPCQLAGKHCESGDVIVRDVLLDDPRAGDVIVTPATGAYGHALANNYNGALRPPVILCSGGSARVAVRRETLEDLVARDVD